jgi:hypothetical protein
MFIQDSLFGQCYFEAKHIGWVAVDITLFNTEETLVGRGRRLMNV